MCTLKSVQQSPNQSIQYLERLSNRKKLSPPSGGQVLMKVIDLNNYIRTIEEIRSFSKDSGFVGEGD